MVADGEEHMGNGPGKGGHMDKEVEPEFLISKPRASPTML